ncbi:hypothetical protein AYI70_g4214, partial [Smittium culicis]
MTPLRRSSSSIPTG